MKPIRRLYLSTLVPCFWLLAASASAVVFTSDTFIGATDTSVDGQDVAVTNCTLTVNGAHGFNSLQIQNGGVLTHSAFTNGPFQITNSVSGESQVMSVTNPATLVNTNVDANTVVVMDSSATITYAAGVDYVISNVAPFTLLWLTTNSAIAEGTNVLVNYNWAQNYQGFTLTISNDMQVLAGGAVNLQGKGYAAGVGMGAGASAFTNFPFSFTAGAGGGHGGYGGMSSTFAAGGNAYDSTTNPVSIGSGGGAGSANGGAGGGVGQLIVGGTFEVDGNILADGLKGTNTHSGGGAGGGLLLAAQTIAGAGTISGGGGKGELPDGGGGGGGIIAIYFATNNFSGSISAFGGAGASSGGAGTIYSHATTNSLGELLISNAGTRGTNTLFSGSIDNLTVSGGAVAQPPAGFYVLSNIFVGSNSFLSSAVNASLLVSVTGNVTVQASGGISVDGKSISGTGAGHGNFTLCPAGSGGGYGGLGGASGCGTAGGINYGSLTQPVSLGSPGGSPITSGGGAINLTVGGALSLGGTISANGASAKQVTSAGGSGGSVLLTVGTLSGNGMIAANGGGSDITLSGGGGGGRIAVYYTTNTFTGNITAKGGAGVNYGGAGSVYLAQYAPQSLGSILAQQVIFDNGGVRGTNTPFGGITTPYNLTITGGAVVTNTSTLGTTIQSLFVGSNSSWIVSAPFSQPSVTVLTNATIQVGGNIACDGQSSSGAAQGQSLNSTGGGGALGGNGGNSASNALGGTALIDNQFNQPTFVGSRGGTGLNGITGGNGGGSLKFTVNRTLQLDGKISADGITGPGFSSGGGSGGSLWLTAGAFSGAGTISANGGAANGMLGGGGGGGMIALYYSTNTFTGVTTARGGAGATFGGAGTVYTASNGAAGAVPLRLTIDNGGNIGALTPVSGLPVSTFDFNITGGAIFADGGSTLPPLRSLLVGSNSSYLVVATVIKSITVLTNATIQAGGRLSEDGVSASANNAGQSLNQTGGGAGHAGYGGYSISNAAGGSVTSDDSITSPTTLGSHGGQGATGFFGGNGGGALRLTVNGTLQLDGRISAEGVTTNGFDSGGGSGGSVWVTTGKLTGAGTISANGGAANNLGGGGGGGRVALWCNSNQFTGAFTVQGGAGANFGGAGTVFISPSINGQTLGGKLIVDNGGNRGTNTLVNGIVSSADVFINSGSTAVFSGGASWNSLTIASNAVMGVFTNPANFSGNLNITSNLTIQAGGSFSLDGSGAPGNSGTGRGFFSGASGGGGSHGGYGSTGASGGTVGNTYDSISGPTATGSGGGVSGIPGIGSAGGGGIHLNVSRSLIVNGTLSANGMPGLASGAGGGSGGSLWLTVAGLAGTGRITADGGAGEFSGGGGGGGGRISATFNSNLFTGTFSARGGAGPAMAGGAGTIYLKTNSSSIAQLVLDNGGAAGTNTPLDTLAATVDVSIRNGAAGTSMQGLAVQDLMVGAGGVFNTPVQSALSLTVFGNVLVDTNGAISADARGFNPNLGTGRGGVDALGDGSGGGYGGAGGNSLFGAAGGIAFGSSNQPAALGCPGGMTPPVIGFSQGGGALRLIVVGTLTLNGSISADGNDASTDGAGGGSGGSLWISAKNLAGNGLLTADGGMGELSEGGGGGGGRIAVYANTNGFTGTALAAGGMGASPGQGGTIVFGTNFVVSGSVADTNGTGIEGINLQGSGVALATTDSNGLYSIIVPPLWSGSITPTSDGVYIPSSVTFMNLSSDAPNENFVLADASIFNFGNPQFDGTNENLNWYGVSGASYQVYSSSNLVDWDVFGPPIQGTNGPAIVIVPTSDPPLLFFRLGVTY